MPKILISVKNWSKIIHPNIDAKTPSKENIIVTGAGERFCWLYTWSKNATPLDKTPAYNSSLYSKSMFEKTIVSKITAGMKAKKDQIKHWKKATMTG